MEIVGAVTYFCVDGAGNAACHLARQPGMGDVIGSASDEKSRNRDLRKNERDVVVPEGKKLAGIINNALRRLKRSPNQGCDHAFGTLVIGGRRLALSLNMLGTLPLIEQHASEHRAQLFRRLRPLIDQAAQIVHRGLIPGVQRLVCRTLDKASGQEDHRGDTFPIGGVVRQCGLRPAAPAKQVRARDALHLKQATHIEHMRIDRICACRSPVLRAGAARLPEQDAVPFGEPRDEVFPECEALPVCIDDRDGFVAAAADVIVDRLKAVALQRPPP